MFLHHLFFPANIHRIYAFLVADTVMNNSNFVPSQEHLSLGLITCFCLWDKDFRMVERVVLKVVVASLYIASNLLHIPSSLM